jgi:hypothetical protein
MSGYNKNCKYGRSDCMPCTNCDAYIPPKTNADRIRAMTDEELAEDYCQTLLKAMEVLGIENTGSLEDAVRVRLEWLQQPCEGE